FVQLFRDLSIPAAAVGSAAGSSSSAITAAAGVARFRRLLLKCSMLTLEAEDRGPILYRTALMSALMEAIEAAQTKLNQANASSSPCAAVVVISKPTDVKASDPTQTDGTGSASSAAATPAATTTSTKPTTESKPTDLLLKPAAGLSGDAKDSKSPSPALS